MMNYRKILIIICCLFILCGCWDRREPELRALALAGGIDINEEGMYCVEVQYACPLGIGSSENESQSGHAFAFDSARGYTPLEALRNLSLGISRELIWSHARFFVVSDKLAQKGMSVVLDLVERDPHIRLLGLPLVIKGDNSDIGRLFRQKPCLELTGAKAIDRQFKTAFFDRATLPAIFSLREVISNIKREGEELIIGKIEVAEKVEEDEFPIKLGGAAVFKKDKMIGWLDEDQVRGYNFIKGKIGRGVLVIDSPNEDDEKITFEFIHTSSSLKPQLEDDNFSFLVNVDIRGSILEVAGTHVDLTRENEFLVSLRKRLAQVVRNDIEASLVKAQELNSDFWGLGNALHRLQPKVWARVKDDWDKIFPEVQVKIDVQVEIRRTGLISSPI